ncbi:MAG: hypothetical protein Q8O92_09190 [Candidatus Latescibacter sp.]|nr:hypothetical protein [Candidatus Latescibacter sp.]
MLKPYMVQLSVECYLEAKPVSGFIWKPEKQKLSARETNDDTKKIDVRPSEGIGSVLRYYWDDVPNTVAFRFFRYQ